MLPSFKLISARTQLATHRRPWSEKHEITSSSSSIEVSFARNTVSGISESQDNHISVLLGKNGEGKSRVLSAIAATFQALDAASESGEIPKWVGREFRNGSFLSHLEYELSGRSYSVDLSPRQISASEDGVRTTIETIKLPKKVLALSMTPFDKFPLHELDRERVQSGISRKEVYSYLGMRERFGRTSQRRMISRVLESIVDRIASHDSSRLTEVFELLGFEPRLEVVYSYTDSRLLEEIAGGLVSDKLFEHLRNSNFSHNKISRELEKTGEMPSELVDAARISLNHSRRRYQILEIDLDEPETNMIDLFWSTQTLRRFGLLRLRAVDIRRYGKLIDLSDASSGELSIALTFLSLAANLEDNSLVLIDEPETNLHPEWQAKYIGLLVRTFKSFTGCQYILATHSPLIVKELPSEATLTSLTENGLRNAEDASGRAVDYLLVEAFNVVGGENYYLQELLVDGLRLAADGQTKGADFKRIVEALTRIRPLLEGSPGVKEIIGDLQAISDRNSSS